MVVLREACKQARVNPVDVFVVTVPYLLSLHYSFANHAFEALKPGSPTVYVW